MQPTICPALQRSDRLSHVLATVVVTRWSGNSVSTISALKVPNIFVSDVIDVTDVTDVCAHLAHDILYGPLLDYNIIATPIVGQGCADIYKG